MTVSLSQVVYLIRRYVHALLLQGVSEQLLALLLTRELPDISLVSTH